MVTGAPCELPLRMNAETGLFAATACSGMGRGAYSASCLCWELISDPTSALPSPLQSAKSSYCRSFISDHRDPLYPKSCPSFCSLSLLSPSFSFFLSPLPIDTPRPVVKIPSTKSIPNTHMFSPTSLSSTVIPPLPHLSTPRWRPKSLSHLTERRRTALYPDQRVRRNRAVRIEGKIPLLGGKTA